MLNRTRIRPRRRGALLTERGQGLALLIFGLAVFFLICLLAKGRFG